MFDNIFVKSLIFKLKPLGVFGGHQDNGSHWIQIKVKQKIIMSNHPCIISHKYLNNFYLFFNLQILIWLCYKKITTFRRVMCIQFCILRIAKKNMCWRAPKFFVRPIWRSKYVEMRKELEFGPLPTSSTKGGVRRAC
jgi:hypothetical protein